MSNMPRILWIGMGAMGIPMAQRISQHGYKVSLWNRSPVPNQPEVNVGYATLPTLVAHHDVIITMVTDAPAVATILTHISPHLRPGQLIIDCSSAEPAQSATHAVTLAAHDVAWVDAPVSGGPEGAHAGTLAIMAGGTDAAISRATPILSCCGRVTHVGGPGAGHTCKIINQVIVGLTLETLAEALTLAEHHGLDIAAVQQALMGGFADSKLLQIHGTRMRTRQYIPGGKVSLQLKDLRMAHGLAQAHQLTLPFLETAIERYTTVIDAGHADADHSVIHWLLNRD
ncbi:MAG: NAD(P)-dependent oxidoreductase [Roseiflexaceae bacterium]